MVRDARVSERRRVERLQAMREEKRRGRLEIYPSPCPTCYAEPGEECITRNGKRSPRHQTRYNPTV